MVRLVMKDDSSELNPFDGLGHFVCVDGFGPVSKEEEAAGLPGHGEAHRVPVGVASSAKQNGELTVQFTAALPLVQESFRRTLRMIDGESVVYIDSELESLLAFDRPINWGEHATISGAFLEQGKTDDRHVGDARDDPLVRIRSRGPARQPQSRRLQGVHWPMAPTVGGALVDMRVSPAISPVMDQTTSLMDPSRRLAYVTALQPDRQALLGYVFKRRGVPVDPDLGFLSRRRTPRLPRYGVRRAAVRSASTRRHPNQLDVRDADVSMASREVEDHLELHHVLHAHPRRILASRRRRPREWHDHHSGSRTRQTDRAQGLALLHRALRRARAVRRASRAGSSGGQFAN